MHQKHPVALILIAQPAIKTVAKIRNTIHTAFSTELRMTPLSLHRSAFLVLLCGALTACGAEVATTAVTATKLQAEQAKQATAQAEKDQGRPGRGHAAHGSRCLGR